MKKFVSVLLVALILVAVLPAFLIVSGVTLTNFTYEQKQAEIEKRIEGMKSIDEEKFNEVYESIVDGTNELAQEIVNRTSEKLSELENPEASFKEYVGDGLWETVSDVLNQ